MAAPSFSSTVKSELARVQPTCSRCVRAQLAALVRVNGTLTQSERGNFRLELATETMPTAQAVVRLLHSVPQLRTDTAIKRSVLHNANSFVITVPAQPALNALLAELGLAGTAGEFSDEILEPLVEGGCCAGAYLRGAFLAAGYIADPKGDFHFEIPLKSERLARNIVALAARVGLTLRSTQRYNQHVVYAKGAEHIKDLLAFMGAHASVLSMEEVRVTKAVRNEANRRANAEFANTVKAAEASMKQIAQMRELLGYRKIDTLPRALQEVILLRVKNPEATLAELGEAATPPLSKSAVYHRLLRIEKLLEEERAARQA